jgi:hypothetical protein
MNIKVLGSNPVFSTIVTTTTVLLLHFARACYTPLSAAVAVVEEVALVLLPRTSSYTLCTVVMYVERENTVESAINPENEVN